jgi:uncharacterized protein
MTGKAITPIIQKDGVYKAKLLGNERIAKNGAELQELQTTIRNLGYYDYLTDQREYDSLASDESKLHDLFIKLMLDTVKNWVTKAEQVLAPSNSFCYLTGGNDDPLELDKFLEEILQDLKHVIFAEGKIVDIFGHEMISCGYSNITPWNCPRDITEDELFSRIESMASKLSKPQTAIFNLHVPPYDSGIDSAPRLNPDLTYSLESGRQIFVPVGSTSVRKSIEEHQPLLGLHGHIHESKGMKRIGGTLCLNPGSQYGEGILNGAVVDLEEKKVKSYVFTAG